MTDVRAIETRDLTEHYGDFIAVDHISFEVEQGELFGFQGARARVEYSDGYSSDPSNRVFSYCVYSFHRSTPSSLFHYQDWFLAVLHHVLTHTSEEPTL